MTRVSVVPENPAHWHHMRARSLTSTDVSTLFGYNRYQSKSKMWNLKKAQQVGQVNPSEAMQYGIDNEDRIARAIGRRNRWAVEPMKEFIQIPELRLGSSFDWARLEFPASEPKVPFEIKTVSEWAFKLGHWQARGTELVKASPYVELQCETQMLVAGVDHMWIGVEVERSTLLTGFRKSNPLIRRMILDKVAEFWKAFDADLPPVGVKVRRLRQMSFAA